MPEAIPTEAARARPSTFRPLYRALRGRLVLLVSLAAVPAVLLAVYVSATERRAAVARTAIEARLVGDLASREHRFHLAGAKALLVRIAPLLADGERTGIDRRAYLRTLLASKPQFANLGLLTEAGDVVISAVETAKPVSLGALPVLERARRSNEVEVGTYTIGPIVDRPVLHLAYAVRGAHGTPVEVAFVALELSWLGALTQNAGLPPEFALFICDREGTVLAASGYHRAVGARVAAGPLLAGLPGQTGGVIRDLGEALGPRFLVASELAGVPGLAVVAGLPAAQVEDEANDVFRRTLGTLMLAIVLAIASALLATELSVLRILSALTRAARRLGSGDLTSRAPLAGSHGELRELAMSFNGMAASLESRQREADDNQARLRALSHRLQTAREEEAGRIARELHDELGQVLTGLKIDLTRLRREFADAPEPGPDHPPSARQVASHSAELAAELRAMAGRIDGAIEFVRRLARELRPSVLDRLGLAAALEWLAHEFEGATGVTVELHLAEVAVPTDGQLALTLFRIVQEALTNVARHAAARHVWIDLRLVAGQLTLTVRDDGRGLAPAWIAGQGSLGMLNMQERARLIGGEWRLTSVPNEGTTITVTLPLASPSATGET